MEKLKRREIALALKFIQPVLGRLRSEQAALYFYVLCLTLLYFPCSYWGLSHWKDWNTEVILKIGGQQTRGGYYRTIKPQWVGYTLCSRTPPDFSVLLFGGYNHKTFSMMLWIHLEWLHMCSLSLLYPEKKSSFFFFFFNTGKCHKAQKSFLHFSVF